jgi:hypothetical protein
MPQSFVMRPRRGGRWGQIGQSGRGRVRIRIGGFEFGIGLRGLLPSIILVGSGRPRSQHPLHFQSPGLPQVLAEACRMNPRVCAPVAVGSSGGPFGLFAGAVVGLTIWGMQQEALRALEKKRKREADSELERERARTRLEQIYNRAVTRQQMDIELPPYFDYPSPVPLIGRPVRPPSPTVQPRIDHAPTRIDVPEITFPGTQGLPGLAYPVPLQLPTPEIAPPRPTVAPVKLPVEFPNWTLPRTLPITWPFAQPLPMPTFRPGDLPLPGQPGVPLTGFQPVGLPSSLVSPQSFADPQAQPKKGQCECPDTRTKTKKRNRCVKGLYRETQGTIFYTPWAKVDCTTGREN